MPVKYIFVWRGSRAADFENGGVSAVDGASAVGKHLARQLPGRIAVHSYLSSQ